MPAWILQKVPTVQPWKSLNDALDELRQAIKDGLENGDPVAVLKSKVEGLFLRTLIQTGQT